MDNERYGTVNGEVCEILNDQLGSVLYTREDEEATASAAFAPDPASEERPTHADPRLVAYPLRFLKVEESNTPRLTTGLREKC